MNISISKYFKEIINNLYSFFQDETIIGHINDYIIDKYTYNCTIDTPNYTDQVQFNKQSNFAYCGSIKSYKLIDCKDGK